jgi:hypothetical protein
MPPVSPPSPSVEKLQELHQKTYKKTGVWLTLSQLLSKAGARPGSQQAIELGRRLRSSHPAGAKFSRFDRRRTVFQTVSPLRPGVYFIDYAEFKKSWSRENQGATGFLVAVENLTNKLFVSPSKGKATPEWLQSIARFVELTRNVSVIYSDRDAVATSPRFAKTMEDKYGLNWKFLRKGNKSFLAERYVGFVKTKLAQALASAKGGSRRWIDFLDPICQEYNRQRVPGTSYTRQSIDKSNFQRFASQLFKDRDIEGRQSSFKAGPFRHHPNWNKKIFGLEIGDRVLVANEANWKFRQPEPGVEKTGRFAKPSVAGSFGQTVYTVSGRQLRANRDFTKMTPVYALKEFGNRHLHFYQTELQKVTYDS